MAVPVVEHSGGGTDSDSTINVTLADTPASTELTVLLVTGAAAANMTLPDGWRWVPRMGGTAGVAGASTTCRLWGIWYLGTPSDTTPDITMSASGTYTWEYVIISNAHGKLPFTSARHAGSSNNSSGSTHGFPGTPFTDSLMLTLASCDASDCAYTSGTFVEEEKQTNGSYSGYIVSNGTDYTAADLDGSAGARLFDTASTGRKMVAVTLCITSGDTDLSSPVVFNASTDNYSSPTSAPVGYPTASHTDYHVPGMYMLVGLSVPSESYTATVKARTVNGLVDLFTLDELIPATAHADVTPTCSVQWWDKLLGDADCVNSAVNSTVADQYGYLWALSGSMAVNVWGMMIAGADPDDPVYAATTAQNVSSATTYDPASRTTVADQLLILAVTQASATAITEPAGYTNLFEGGNRRTSCNWKTMTGASEDPGAFSWSSGQWIIESSILINQLPVPQPPVNTVAPAISNVPEVGQTLACSTGTWTGDSPISYAYQWEYNDGTWHDITGATTSTWAVDVSGVVDLGDTIRCKVTATNSVGTDDAYSNTTGAITAVTFTDQYMGVAVS